MPDDSLFSEVNPPVGDRAIENPPTRSSTARATETSRRSSGCSPDICARCNAGQADGCRDGRAPSPTPTTLSGMPCFRPLSALESSSLVASVRCTPDLRRAVVNRLRDELRRKGRRPDSTDLDDLELAKTGSPIEAAIGREAVEHYERELERLKPEERDLIIARVEMDYTYDELALAFGPTPDAARKAAQQALMRLAEEMTRG
jgi:hypothetical protein